MVTEKQKQNLVNGQATQFHCGENATRMGRMGGIASGQARRRKKTLAQLAQAVVSSELEPDTKVYNTVKQMAGALDEEDLTVGALMLTGQANAAAKGNAHAMRVLMELTSQAESTTGVEQSYHMSALNLTTDTLPVYRAVWAARDGSKPLREIVLKGGRGGGKSSFVAELAYEAMQRDPLANVVYLRRYRSDLRPTVFQQFCRVIGKHGNESAWKVTTAPMECVRTETGNACYFFGADNPIQAKSFTPRVGYVALLVFEECDELQGLSYVQDAEFTYLRSNGSDQNQLAIMVFNPPASKQNWMNQYTRELENNPSALAANASYLSVPPEWLGERFLQQAEWLKEHKPDEYRNKLLGEVTGTGGELFTNVEEATITDAQIEAFELHGWIYQGVDWGYEHPNVFVRVAYNPDTDTVYPLFEKYERHANAEKFQRGIRRFRSAETICDSAEPDKIADWLDLGWNAFAAVKRWKGGGRSYAWEWLRSRAHIVVDRERTPKLLHELQTLEFERLRDGSYTSAYPTEGEDGVMATIYALNRVIVAGKSPIPDSDD